MPPELGRVITGRRVFTQADFDRFAALSGDDNPIHVDPEFASTTKFGSTVAHGMLLYGVICALIGEHYPGSIQLEQRMMFLAPNFTGEEITTRAEIVEINEDDRQMKLSVLMTAGGGKVVCDGETTLLWRES